MLVQNEEALKKFYPGLLSPLNQIDAEKIRYSVEPVDTNGYKNLFYNSSTMKFCLHSQYDPINEARHMIQSNHESASFNIIVGGGLYYHVDYALQECPGKKLIVIEPSLEIFKQAIETRDISHLLLSEDVLFIVSDQIYEIILMLARILINEGVQLFNIFYLPAYRALFKDFCSNLEMEIFNVIKTLRANIGTEYIHSRKWIVNTLKNLKYTNVESVSIRRLFDKFKQKPALIVSAGPSLNKQIDLIKANAGKFLIFASGSAVNVLERNGITPHFMVAIDSEEVQDNIFNAICSDQITLAYGHTLRYTSFKQFNGKKMWFKGNADPIIEFFEEENNFKTDAIEIGPSCANEAMELARKFGCNPIVFVGQDLAYTGEALYSTGVVHDLNMHTDIGDRILTEDVHGNPVYTKTAFLVMKSYFENYVRIHSEVQYVNCTEGGLNIQGMENRKFEQLIESIPHETVDWFNYIDLLYEEEKECIKNLNFEETTPDFLNEILLEAKHLDELSNSRIKLVGEILESVEVIDYATGKAQMEDVFAITEEFEESDVFKYILSPIAAAYMMSVRQNTYRSMDSDNSIMKKFEQLLLGIEKQYKFMHVMLKAVLEALADA